MGRPDGTSAYFRLTTRQLDQSLSHVPLDDQAIEQRRRDVLSGGYVVEPAVGRPQVTLVGMGTIMPEVLAAATALRSDGVEVEVICLTSADLVFRAMQARQGLATGDASVLTRLFPADRAAPIVTVLDGHSHTLSFLAGINGTRIANLGVQDFGRSGDIDELYEYFGIDTATIIGATWDLL